MRGVRARVFPTRVGMAQPLRQNHRVERRFPHPRGDGPREEGAVAAPTMFSPPAWGWPVAKSRAERAARVFPTRVGMARRAWPSASRRTCFPHPRGDGPIVYGNLPLGLAFSPPAWGWPLCGIFRQPRLEVFPTRVGMARGLSFLFSLLLRFPHPRGDGPDSPTAPLIHISFSPPAWGWPFFLPLLGPLFFVFPTRVGMARSTSGPGERKARFPHPRGDGPHSSDVADSETWFSPPAWGWPARRAVLPRRIGVFPTRVGMARQATAPGVDAARFPHPRGDGPYSVLSILSMIEFSPPAWGWPAIAGAESWPAHVFPTRVGMARECGIRMLLDRRFPHPRGDGPTSRNIEHQTTSFSPPAWGWPAHR